MKGEFLTCAVIAVLTLSSCEKTTSFTVNSRTPNLTEFQRRVLPEGFRIGSALPNGAEPVDLGLSVQWANMSLGAEYTDEPGDLYAWGEISPSGNYGWDCYEFNDYHSNDKSTLYLTKYCFDRYGESQDLDKGGVTLDSFDDAAYLSWGEGWRMPTQAELTELSTKCTWTYCTATKTFTVTGPSGNFITVPYEGIGIQKGVYSGTEITLKGGLWSSTLAENESPFACQLWLDGQKDDKFEIGMDNGGANRCYGCYIRPVYVAPVVEEPEVPVTVEAVYGTWKLRNLSIQTGVCTDYEATVTESGKNLIEISIPTNGHDETEFDVTENISYVLSDGTTHSLIHKTYRMGLMPMDYSEDEYSVPGHDFTFTIIWKGL